MGRSAEPEVLEHEAVDVEWKSLVDDSSVPRATEVVSSGRRLLTNNILLTAAHVVTKACTLITLALTARYLGAVHFGQLAFAATVVGYFGVLQDMGLNTLSIREVARDKREASRYMANVLGVRFLLTLATIVLLLAIAAVLNKPPEVKLIIVIASLGGLPAIISVSNEILFAAHEKFQYKAILNVASGILAALMTVAVLLAGYGVVAVVVIGVVSLSVTAVLSWWVTRFRFPLRSARFDWVFAGKLVRRSLPFGLTTLFAGLYFRLSIAMLSLFKGEMAVGWFYASFRLMESLLFLPGILAMTLYPVMSGLAGDSHERLQRLFASSVKIVLTGALAVAVGTTILARPIINLFYGGQYGESIRLLQILIWVLVLACINTIMMFVILAKNGEKTVLKATIVLAIVSFLGNLVFIPRYGAQGAAVVTVFVECAGTLYYWTVLRRHALHLRVWGYMPRVGPGLIIMGACSFALRHSNLGVALSVSALAYVSLLLLTRVFDREELVVIRDAVRRLKQT
ncbi:MAG: flippase [Candidatus Eisenbacteria bacterium]